MKVNVKNGGFFILAEVDSYFFKICSINNFVCIIHKWYKKGVVCRKRKVMSLETSPSYSFTITWLTINFPRTVSSKHSIVSKH